MKKKFFGAIAFAAVALAIAFNLGVKQDGNKLSALAMANVEALAQSEDASDYRCKLIKDKCKFKISTTAELNIVRKLARFGSVELGMEIDLTDATQIFVEASWYDTKVRCGKDITCHDVLSSLGLFKS